ncbi:Gfo/Idh/MocA family protein [Microbacterium sp. Marseille-Q6965]|uniref:Gfo/Idh/MocA family protein n=1 Tax=Microbacterium sp. Marseille-Q6965 TaxID=2965072 RepID=UPI0021B7FFBF|nr:Gfo/Idh/MocA family oxidoreductase [Microbacterium sp. Marseille-Q6965]
MTERYNAAVIGAGYWGPNLARNLRAADDWNLAGICDLDRARAARVAESVGGAPVWTDIDEVLGDPLIDAVAIATPARTHRALVCRALEAGKHVMVEKPLADGREAGETMVALARERGLVLMTDHTYCYTPAVMKIRELIAQGRLGDILYVDSTRINLGLVQSDVDVLWDLAPHDLAILDFVLPGGLPQTTVSALGADPLGTGRACVGFLAMPLPGGGIAHIQVNWLSPTKIRRMVIGGTRSTLVWDDLNPQQRVSVFDRGVDLASHGVEAVRSAQVSYRIGDTWSPALPEREALAGVVAEFAAAIRGRRAPRTDGASGLRVLSVLAAATQSLERHGEPVAVAAPTPVPAAVPALEG